MSQVPPKRTSKKKRRGYLSSSSEILQSVLQEKSSPISTQFTRWKLWHCWENVVGKDMAQYTTPVGYLRGRLYIWVRHPTHMQNLIFMVGPIRDKINQFIGRKWVQSIRFTLDRRSVPEQAEMSEEFRKFLSMPSPSKKD